MAEGECRLPFENTGVGRLKEKIFNLRDDEVWALLKEYGVPAPGEMEKPGSYLQNTVRK